jgi:hypothetical protein
MDGAVVGVDDELAVRPLGVFVSADQKLQGELFEDMIVGGVEFVVGQVGEDGARFSDVLDEEFVGEVGEQRVHDGSFRYLTFQVRKRSFGSGKKSFAPLTALRDQVKEPNLHWTRRSMVAKQHLEKLVLKFDSRNQF